jgi:hypothetical protein
MTTGLNDPAKLTSFSFSIPFVGEVSWAPDPTQRKAAWELYVELVTRVSTQSLDLEGGLLREALNSLYSLFDTTREILRAAGPDVGAGPDTVGGVAIAVLNKGVRPVLTKWHPQLQAHEALRPPVVTPRDWERQWKDEALLRGVLHGLGEELGEYARTLAVMAGTRK